MEAGGSYRQLTNGFGDWSGGYARGVLAVGKNILTAEINGQYEFGADGVYLAAGDTYNFNSDWYASLTLGSSVGGFFWPRFRADAFVNRKWLARKQFITTLGYGYYASARTCTPTRASLSERLTISKGLGSSRTECDSTSAIPAWFSRRPVLWLSRKVAMSITTLTINAGLGQKGYQIVGPTTALTRFPSQNLTITWRQWTGERVGGFNLVADYYHSPFYERWWKLWLL